MIDHRAPILEPPWQFAGDRRNSVLIGTRVTLHRNLDDLPFPHRMDRDEWMTLRREVERAFMSLSESCTLVDGEAIGTARREILAEWGILSNLFHPPLSIIGSNQKIITQLGYQDHMQIHLFGGGGDAGADLLTPVQALDTALEPMLNFAVSLRLGYLSPRIDAVGPGITLLGILFLPALHRAGTLIPQNIAQHIPAPMVPENREIKPFRIRSTPVDSLFQIQITSQPGDTEEEMPKKLARAVERLVHYELEGRDALRRDHHDLLQDAAYRAWGTLQHARKLERQECDESASLVALAAMMGLVEEVDPNFALKLPFFSSDEVTAALEPGSEDLTYRRAQLIRRQVGKQEIGNV